MADISNLIPSATSTPDQAATNIQNAAIYSMPATSDKGVNDAVSADIHQSLKPTEASPAVHEYMNQSTEHAALALGADPKDPTKSDIPVHNYVADTVKWIGDLIHDHPTDDQKRNTLLNKQMDNDGRLSPEDASDLYDLNQLAPKPGPPEPPPQLEKKPGQISLQELEDSTKTGPPKGAILDSLDSMARGVRHNLPLISAFTGAGMMAGVAGGPFAEVTVPAGAAAGFGLGLKSAFALDAYDSTRASIYGTLSNMTDKDGHPSNIDESTKKRTAYGAGLVSAALMTVEGDAVVKAIPFLNPKMTPAFVKAAMQAPETAAARLTLQRIGATMATMGVVGGVQEFSNIVAETVGKSYDGTSASILNGLNEAAHKLENMDRIAKGAAANALTGGVIAGTLGALGAKSTKAQVEGIAERGREIIRDTQVTMGKPAGLIGENDSAFSTRNGTAPEGEPPRAPPKDVTPSRPPEDDSVQQSMKAMKFRDAMVDVNEAIQQTRMHDVSPNETTGMMQKIFEHAGIDKVFTTIQNIKNWATTPEKGIAARNLMNKSGMFAAAATNTPVEIDPVDVSHIAKTDPKIWDHIQLDPHGPTALKGEAHLDILQKAAEAQAKIMSDLGIKPEEVAPTQEPSNVVPIGAKAKGEAVPFDLEEHTRRANELLNKIKSPFSRILDSPDGFMGSIPKAEKLPAIEHKTSGGVDVTLSGGGKEQPMEGATGKELKMVWPSVFAKDSKGNVIGSLSVKPEGEGHVAAYVEVDPKHQRKGVASALYQYANAHIAKINPSQFRTEEGKKFAENFDYAKLDEKSKKMIGVEKLQAELADIKSKVTEHFQGREPGKLLIAKFDQWPEPGEKEADTLAHQYLDQMSIPEAIKKVLPKAEVEQFEAATRRAREDHLAGIVDSVNDEQVQVQDTVVEAAKEARLEQERQRIADDPNYAIVDKIRSALKLSKADKSEFIYAIDPKSLPDNLIKFTDNPRIKETKIFQKGGNNANDVAILLNVKDGEELLNILAKTPTREVVSKARADAFRVADEQEARGSVDPNYVRAIEVIDNEQANLVAQMKFMREQEWPALKGGIKRIALPLQPVAEWTGRAKDLIAQTKVGSLNANIYKVAERQSHRNAVNAFLKGEFLTAYEELGKRGVALASLKEATIKITQIDRAQKFMRDFASKDTRAILRRAGPTISNAALEINGLFNFNPNTKAQVAIGAYLKWATREVNAGRGNFSIPDRLNDIRKSVKDMTVEQVLVLSDRARVLLKSAKDKGQILTDLENVKEKRNLDQFEAAIIEKAKKFPNPILGSKSGRLPEVQEELPKWQNHLSFFSDLDQLIAGKQNIYRELDQGHTGGEIYNGLDAAMEGSGEHFEKSGFTYTLKFNKWVDTNIKRINKSHGDPHSLETKIYKIDEFKDLKDLRHGNLTKGDMLMALGFSGQEYTKNMLVKNNGADIGVWQKVWDKHLTPKDVQHLQAVIDLYKDPALRAKTIELQKAQGRDIEFIEGIGFTHQGVEYPGGYVPVKTRNSKADQLVKQALEELEGKPAAHFEKANGDEWGRQYAAETTKQGYTISRVGNDGPLDLTYARLFDGLREIGHDHAYRQPVEDFFNKMKRKGVRDSLIAMVGEKKVNNLISTNLEIAGRPSARNAGYYWGPDQFIKNVYTKAGANFAIYTILGNFHAVAIQFEALPQLFNALGLKSMGHFINVNVTMGLNPTKLWGFIESAKHLDPSIGSYIDGVNERLTSSLDTLVPRKGQKLRRSIVGQGLELASFSGFLPHQMVDLYLKVAAAHTVMKHVMAGDHPLYPKAKIDAMTQEQQFKVVQGIAQQASTLFNIQNRHELKAPIQKNLATSVWTPFWNYPRNIINNTLLDGRKFLWKTKEGMEKLQSGGGGSGVYGKTPTRFDDMRDKGGEAGGGRDYKGAAKDFASATAMLTMSTSFRAIGGLMLLFLAKKKIESGLKELDINNPDSIAHFGMHLIGEIMALNFDQAVHSSPVAANMEYAAESKRKYRMSDVKNPQTQQLSSLTTCLTGVKDLILLSRHPDRMQMRACLETSGALISPVLAKGFKMAMDWESSTSMPDLGPGFHAQFNTSQVDDFHKDLKEFVKNPGDANKDLVAQADALQKQLAPVTVEVPPQARDVIRMASSGGLWDKPNGLYGFTSDNWKSIMKSAPELGLTDAGRTSKNSTQQEKAIDWSLKENAGLLAEKDIPVNNLTMYGSHVLGVTDYLKVYNAPADTKTKSVLSADVIKDHPELANFKTIGQVKGFFSKAVSDNNLTSKTSKNED